MWTCLQRGHFWSHGMLMYFLWSISFESWTRWLLWAWRCWLGQCADCIQLPLREPPYLCHSWATTSEPFLHPLPRDQAQVQLLTWERRNLGMNITTTHPPLNPIQGNIPFIIHTFTIIWRVLGIDIGSSALMLVKSWAHKVSSKINSCENPSKTF